MWLSELVAETVEGWMNPSDFPANETADVDIVGLTSDSREVRSGFLFAALPGQRARGEDFVGHAVERGAVAVLASPYARPGVIPSHVRLVQDANPRRRFARMAARFFGRQPNTVAAVTGTNGKTSVVEFTRQLWTNMGIPAASIGTLGTIAPAFRAHGMLTTPEPVALHRTLADLAARNVDHLAMEASSHGLDQHRLDGVRITAAAFTNLSRDHLDYHGTMAAYRDAKARLFRDLLPRGGTAVLNADDEAFPGFREASSRPDIRILTFGFRDAHIRLEKRTPSPHGQRLGIAFADRRFTVDVPLLGAFQASNLLCAFALVVTCGGEVGAASNALGKIVAVPGRMQRVARRDDGASVYVDYAHTPEALRHALSALRSHAVGRLVLVFGCGGERDPGKRPEMGAIAKDLADVVIVTDDNPRGENPSAIRRQILAACRGAREIGDRREAIRTGLSELGSCDVLVVAGKGHEPGQIVGGRVFPFDDAEVAKRTATELWGTPEAT